MKDYARILEALSGRTLVRNDYSKYEAVGLVLLRVNPQKGEPPVLSTFPSMNSDLHIDAFFANLYHMYDLRYPFTYTDPSVKNLERVAWDAKSPVLVSMSGSRKMERFLGYRVRESGE